MLGRDAEKRQIVKLQQVTDSRHARDRCNLCRLCPYFAALCTVSRLRDARPPALSSFPSSGWSRCHPTRGYNCVCSRKRRGPWVKKREGHIYYVTRPLCSTSLEKPTKFLKRLFIRSLLAVSCVNSRNEKYVPI